MDLVETLRTELPSLPALALSLALCTVLATLIKKHYIKYGAGLANREEFARNFLVVALAVTLIISIVKGSLTLSLGLVGALSIVRFRTPIKDPEELSYLFLAIATGIGLGANQPLVTTLAILVILALLTVRAKLKGSKPASAALYLEVTLTGQEDPSASLESLTGILDAGLEGVRLRRMDTQGQGLHASFSVRCEREALAPLTRSIHASWPEARVTLLDQANLLDG